MSDPIRSATALGRAAIAGLVLLVAVLGAAWWLTRPPAGLVVALAALEDGSAAVVLAGSGNPAQFALVRLGPDGLPVAWRALDGAYETRSEAPGLVALDDALYLRLVQGGRVFVAAFAQGDLAPRWRADIAAAEASELRRAALFFAGGLLLVPLRGDESATLVAVSQASGEVAWRTVLPEAREFALGAPLMAGSTLIVRQGSWVWTLRVSDGAVVRSLRYAFFACIGADGAAWADVDGAVVALGATPETDRVVVPPAAIEGSRVFGCGAREGHALARVLDRDRRRSSLIGGAVDEARWTVDLDGGLDDLMGTASDAFFAGRTPLTAPATRFLPLLLAGRFDSRPPGSWSYGLAIVDVDAGRVSARHEIAGFPPALAATVDGRHYVAPSLHEEPEVELLDGASGALVAAVRVAPLTALTLDPSAIAGGRLWMFEARVARADALGLVVLDATTLAPLVVRGEMHVTDTTAEARARWPAPP